MSIKTIIISSISVLIFLLCFQVQVKAQEKLITIHNENISLKDVFLEIERQTDYSVAYKNSGITESRTINVSVTNASLKEALKEILKDNGIDYKINGYHIILVPKSKKAKSTALTQTIRGVVYDVATELPIEFANIALSANPDIGTITDSLGRFELKNIPIGYAIVNASFIGYKPYIYRDILLTSAREVIINIPLKENSQSIDEVTVRPQVNKERTINPMVLTGGRLISIEEGNRFAGAFNDPARLVSSFAGVSGTGGISSNALSIRGNAPQYAQYRLEGVEIPNPTHFADMLSLGGGVYSALSSQVMGNSDFFNGAYPAEYNNAIAGTFDMHIRNGNNQKHQRTLQVSTIGMDVASEGPLSKKHNSSYIFNYRYSRLGSVTDANLKSQDLSFKFNLPTQNAGTFSLWGLGLIDRNTVAPVDKEDWQSYDDRQDVKTGLNKSSGGLTHRYNINKSSYVRTSLAGTYSGIVQDVWQVDSLANRLQVVDITNTSQHLVLNSYINKKVNSRFVSRTGITLTGMNYDLAYNITPNYGLDLPMENVAKGSGSNYQVSGYTQSIYTFNPKISISAGINAQYFNLNNSFGIEPRLSAKWNFAANQNFSIAYGLNSRRERLDFYYVVDTASNNSKSNKNLDLAKSHHFNFAYGWHISDELHFKLEPYYQYLFDVPVEANSSFSVLNMNSYYLDKLLINSGNGENYGVDLTLERFLSKGSYYLLACSIFKSKYTGGDKVWRSTRYDRGYIFSGVWGKEWFTKRNKNNSFGLNLKCTYQGGERYSPIDWDLSETEHEIVFDESKAFSKQHSPYLNGDITISYRINRKKVSHEIALKGINIGLYTGETGQFYNEATQSIEQGSVTGAIYDICYKISF